MVRLGILCLLLGLLAACDEDRGAAPVGSGGSGGIAGTGGAGGEGPAIDDLCLRACDVLAPCDGDDAAACVAACLGAPASAPVFATCVECLESAGSCDGVRLGCRQGPACDMAWDLVVEGEGLERFEGRTARVLVVEAVEGERWVDFVRQVVIEDGAFSVEMIGALPTWGIPFDVVVAIDGDGDGACATEGVDAAWRRSVGVPERDVRILVRGADPQAPAALAFWEAALPVIVLEGRGLSAFDGKFAIAAPIWIDPTFLSVGELVAAPIEAGAFRVELGDFGDYVEEMAPESEIRAAWMIDVDGDWICSDADVGGTGLVPPEKWIERRVVAGPSGPGSAPCELLRGVGHDVVLHGDGWDRHEGRQVEAALLDEDERVVAFSRGRVEAGALRLRFAHAAVPQRRYAAAIWVDVDGDWSCAVPQDETRLVDLGTVRGAHAVAIPYEAGSGDAALCVHFRIGR